MPVKVFGPLSIAIDPATSTGQTTIHVKNVSGTKLAASVLYMGDFTSSVTARPIGAQTLFAKPDESTGKPAFMLGGTEPGEIVSIKVLVSGVWEAGPSLAPLLLDGVKIAEILARKERTPFNVKLESVATPDAPLRFEQGIPQVILLKNDDAMSYRYSWQISSGNTLVRGGEKEPALLASSSVTPISARLPDDFFPGGFGGLFRDDRRQAQLQIRALAIDGGDPAALPVRTFPLSLRLARWPDWATSFFGGVFVFLILTAGGLASLFLNHSVPTAVRRLAVRQRLGRLGARLTRLPQLIDSHIRVELRVIRLELSRRVAAEKVLFPGAAEVIEQAARETSVLEQRIAVVEKLGEALQHIAAMSAEGPPRLLAREEVKLTTRLRAISHSNVGEPELQVLAGQVGEVSATLERIEKNDPELRDQVTKDARAYWTDTFAPLWKRALEPPDGASLPLWASSLKQQLGSFVERAGTQFRAEPKAGEGLSNTVGDSLEAIDTAYAKLELIAGYIRFCDGATPRQQKAFDEPGFSGPWAGAPATGTTPAEDTDLVVQRERFLRCLSGKGRRSLAQAQLVLRQAEQGIFVKDVAAQLKNGAFAITMEPQTVRELEVVLLRVVFNEDKYNGSAARDKVDCVWTFTHGSIAMQEKGWQACHFFSEGEASVSVEFRRGSKVFVIPQPAGQSGGPATRSLQVGERTKDSRKEQTKLELVQLGVALGATMLALMAGAREQIQKLDLLAGVAVVFALGFGADVLKNLVSRRTTTSEPAPPAR